MMLGEIVFTGVANNKNDDCILIQVGCHTECSCEIRPRGTAAKDSLHASQKTRHLKRLSIRDVNHFVDVLDLNVRRHYLLTDSFDEVRSRLHNLSRLLISLENGAIGI